MGQEGIARKIFPWIPLTLDSQAGRRSREALPSNREIQGRKIGGKSGKRGVRELKFPQQLGDPEVLWVFQLWVFVLSHLLSLDPKPEDSRAG